MMKPKTLFATAAAVLITLFGLGLIWQKGREAEQTANAPRVDRSLLERMHSPSLGPREAKVVITEFFDPACGTCAAFAPIVKEIMAAQSDKIRLVIRYLPLHPGADQVVAAIEAARRQDKLWAVLEYTFANQPQWTEHHVAYADRLLPRLPALGVDTARLAEDMKSPAVADAIMQDVADARALGVNKTPGFFVNGRPLEPFGVEPLKALIKAELKANYP